MATEETNNDVKKIGGYLKEKLAIVKSRVTNDEVVRAIAKVTSHKLKIPNEKHMERLVQATHGNFNAGSAEYNDVCSFIVQELVPHTHTRNWIVVLKTLLVFHQLLLRGSDEVVEHIVAARQAFNTQYMKDLADSPDGAQQMELIHHYARYLEERCIAAVSCRGAPRVESPKFADLLCAATPEVAAQHFDALLLVMVAALEFEFLPRALNNFASLEAFKNTLSDAKRLHVILTRRMAVTLETFALFPLPEKKTWLRIYKRYTDTVVRLAQLFSQVNSQRTVAFGETYPTIRPMPETIVADLEEAIAIEEVPVVKLASMLPASTSPHDAAVAAVASGTAAAAAQRSRSPDLFRNQRRSSPAPASGQQTAATQNSGGNAPQPPPVTAPRDTFSIDALFDAPPPQPPSYAAQPTQPTRVVDNSSSSYSAAQRPPQQQQASLFQSSGTSQPQPQQADTFDPFAAPTGPVWAAAPAAHTTPAFDPFAARPTAQQPPAAVQTGGADFFAPTTVSRTTTGATGTAAAPGAPGASQLDLFAASSPQQQGNSRAQQPRAW